MNEIQIIIEKRGVTVTFEELERTVAYAKRTHPVTKLRQIIIDGEDVELLYDNQPFDRIHRITGYLTGTDDRWNDAKRAELKDRVKHGVVM